MKRDNMFWGLLLIALGVLFLLDRYFSFHLLSIERLWPLFVLVPGLIFEASFFLSMKNPGLLVPGGILTTLGLLFLFETYTGWRFTGRTWPVFPFAVAIGLFQLYLFGGRQKGLLIPVVILAGVSLVSLTTILFGSIASGLVLPVALILVGAYIIFNGLNKR